MFGMRRRKWIVCKRKLSRFFIFFKQWKIDDPSKGHDALVIFIFAQIKFVGSKLLDRFFVGKYWQGFFPDTLTTGLGNMNHHALYHIQYITRFHKGHLKI